LPCGLPKGYAHTGKERHMTGPTPRFAWLAGEYPKVSHTFIGREIAALRAQGLDILTCTIRRTARSEVMPDQEAEDAATFALIETARRHPLRLIAAHARLIARSPARYARSLALALRSGSPGIKARLYQIFYFAEAGLLAEHLRAEGVTHLHNHFSKASCSVAMLTSALSGIPYSFTMHGPDIFYEPQRWRIDEKIARAAFVACISDFCRSQAMLFSDPRHWHKLHIVHCGIDPALYARPDTHPPGAHLVFTGRLADVKGVPVLLDATATLTDIPGLRLTLIGDGPDRAALQARATALGLAGNVTFAGYQTSAAVAALLKTADALVLPSFAEGLPVVLMEAMATSLPVIATQIAGIPELVRDAENGRLVPPGNAPALAAAIRDILSDAARARAMGQAGQARVAADHDSATEAARLRTLLSGPCAQIRPDPAA
jgi:glycosyltransferase involved in cell wall biosynthesis